ncbi:hypothetical protein C8J56DRAFT_902589 [Mycena floridula]|nr:hypothetical protein C8J56DRAFT_902589 [Mycena floridula]
MSKTAVLSLLFLSGDHNLSMMTEACQCNWFLTGNLITFVHAAFQAWLKPEIPRVTLLAYGTIVISLSAIGFPSMSNNPGNELKPPSSRLIMANVQNNPNFPDVVSIRYCFIPGIPVINLPWTTGHKLSRSFLCSKPFFFQLGVSGNDVDEHPGAMRCRRGTERDNKLGGSLWSASFTALEDVLCACSAYEKRPVILMMSATAPESPPLAVSELRHLHSIGMTLGHTKLASLDATSSSTNKSF